MITDLLPGTTSIHGFHGIISWMYNCFTDNKDSNSNGNKYELHLQGCEVDNDQMLSLLVVVKICASYEINLLCCVLLCAATVHKLSMCTSLSQVTNKKLPSWLQLDC